MFSSARYADASGKALSPGVKVQCFEKDANGELKPNVRRGVGAVHKLTSKGVLVKARAAPRPPLLGPPRHDARARARAGGAALSHARASRALARSSRRATLTRRRSTSTRSTRRACACSRRRSARAPARASGPAAACRRRRPAGA